MPANLYDHAPPMTPLPKPTALLATLLLLLSAATCSRTSALVRPDYQRIAQQLEPLIQREMEDKGLPAVSIALVDDQEIVYAQGFGLADLEHKTPATPETVYRVGSVSKLFTDVAVMQLVERGELDLDVPVTNYLPSFQPHNPYGKPITLRQLMSHRAGLVREPPVGHYFDDTEPTLAQTVASLNQTSLVYPPESRIKYSNAGIAVVGYVLETRRKQPFASYLKQSLLDPIGLTHSAFEPSPAINHNLAKALMWSYDGRQFPAPSFQLGMAPAGSMYATGSDLARFMSVLFAAGQGPRGPVLKPETLAAMWTPQFAGAGAKRGFGLGFFLSSLEGQRAVGHAGAIYGFATQLSALPDAKLGAVAVTTVDAANDIVERICEHALRLMLAQRSKVDLPPWRPTTAVDPGLARRLDGRYAHGLETLRLTERNGALYLEKGSTRERVRSLDSALVTDGRLAHGAEIQVLDENRITVDSAPFVRTTEAKPGPPPERWQNLIGEYGWDHNILFILEKGQQLHALIEWLFLYPLTEIDDHTFGFPDEGLYHGEKLVFHRDPSGRAGQVEAAGIVFKRRQVGPKSGETFRIDPLKPVDQLRQAALAARPPAQPENLLAPDLVDLAPLDPTLRFDIRYATSNNFMGTPFYPAPRAFLQRPAAEALVRAHQKLKASGYGLLIHDAYRPWYVTKMFWDATPPSMKQFVANPEKGSVHNRGAAVDLTLYELASGAAVEMPGGYDEFSERSYPDYMGGTSLQRWRRERLRHAMEAEGFTVYDYEWWHFDYKDAARYPVLNLPLGELPPH